MGFHGSAEDVMRKMMGTGLAVMVGLSGSASALEQMPERYLTPLRNNCTGDYITHCLGVNPNSADAFQCLRRNIATLSPACQQAVRAVPPPKNAGQ